MNYFMPLKSNCLHNHAANSDLFSMDLPLRLLMIDDLDSDLNIMDLIILYYLHKFILF